MGNLVWKVLSLGAGIVASSVPKASGSDISEHW